MGRRIPLELESFASEALLYKTPEDFIKAVSKSYIEGGDVSRTPDRVWEIRREMGTLADYRLREQEDWFGRGTRFATRVPKPNELFPVYRATRGRSIRPGDYVTQSRKYAQEHLEVVLGEGNILSTIATTSDITPVNPNEFWYVPKAMEQFRDLRDFWMAAKDQLKGFVVGEDADIVTRLRELGAQLISAANRKDYALANEISKKKSELVKSYVDERVKKADTTLLPDEVILDYLKGHGMEKAGELMFLHPRIAPRLRLHESVEIRELERLAGKPVAEMKASEFYELYSIAHQIANFHAAPMLATEEVIGRFNTEKEMLEKLKKAVKQFEEMEQKGLWEYGVREKIIKP